MSAPHSPVGSSAHSSNPVDGSPSPTTQSGGSPSMPSSPLDTNISLNIGDDPMNEGESNEGEKRLRSPYWAHYNRVMINGQWKAICKYCLAKLSGNTNNGTSHLYTHYIRKHQKKDNMRQQVLTTNMFKGGSQLTSYSFDHETSRKELAKAVVMHEYPLSIVDHIGFKRFLQSLQPIFKVPCRNTLKSDIFKVYDYQRGKTLDLVVSNASRLAITTDMWTSSNQKKGFMAVTAHFIDDSWHLQSRIMRFIYVPCPHTKEVLCEHLLECLMDWNIDRKISCVTVDNCTTNDAMVGLLEDKLGSGSLLMGGDLFHMRCCAHILNLIVKDGLDVIKMGIDKVRDSVAYWTSTGKRKEKFEESARQLDVPCGKKPALDCPTRWNSTFLMLETALPYKEVFIRLSKRDGQYKTLPNEQEWEFAKVICGRLKIFFRVTELFSGTRYPTANQCFPNICEIRVALKSWLYDENEVIREMARKMSDKFDKYWSVTHGIIAVSSVLDPRKKLKVLDFYYSKLFPDTYEDEVQKVRQLCYKMLKEYQSPSSVGVGESSGDCSFDSTPMGVEHMSEFDIAQLHASKRSRTIDTARLEMDLYLSEDNLPPAPGFDVLIWWKSNQPKYPFLAAMARDLLAVPVSTVASESAFSASGRLVSPHRSRLHPDTMEALMCTQSWLWAEEMKGDTSLGYATIYEEVLDTSTSEASNVTVEWKDVASKKVEGSPLDGM